MRTLMIATGDAPAQDAAGERPPAFLLPLVDRPFLQHIVEYLADTGLVEKMDVVLCQLPEKVEELLGDGTRWGIRIGYHLARDCAKPYSIIKRLASEREPILLIHGDCLPQAALKKFAGTGAPVAFRSENLWTGWAVLDPVCAAAIQPNWGREEVARHVLESAKQAGAVEDCPTVLSFRTEADLITSQRTVLNKRFHGLLFYGREVQQGIWIGRNVSLHPTATLVPPVYLGENSRIGAGIRIGPNAVVVRNCILDRGTTVADSAILPGSYVGQALELDHVIVDRNRLVNVREGGQTIVRDDFILSGITQTSWRSALFGLLSRVAGVILLALTWPLILLSALWLRCFREGPLVRREPALRLPAAENPWEWSMFEVVTFADAKPSETVLEHFFTRFLPGLINVVRGELHLVGVPHRNREEVLALPSDWRILYLRSKAGLVSEALALHGTEAAKDELYTCEVYYSVAAGLRHDAFLLLRYLLRLLQFREGRGERPAPNQALSE